VVHFVTAVYTSFRPIPAVPLLLSIFIVSTLCLRGNPSPARHDSQGRSVAAARMN
jgi:hypothetical protein